MCNATQTRGVGTHPGSVLVQQEEKNKHNLFCFYGLEFDLSIKQGSYGHEKPGKVMEF